MALPISTPQRARLADVALTYIHTLRDATSITGLIATIYLFKWLLTTAIINTASLVNGFLQHNLNDPFTVDPIIGDQVDNTSATPFNENFDVPLNTKTQQHSGHSLVVHPFHTVPDITITVQQGRDEYRIVISTPGAQFPYVLYTERTVATTDTIGDLELPNTAHSPDLNTYMDRNQVPFAVMWAKVAIGTGIQVPRDLYGSRPSETVLINTTTSNPVELSFNQMKNVLPQFKEKLCRRERRIDELVKLLSEMLRQGVIRTEVILKELRSRGIVNSSKQARAIALNSPCSDDVWNRKARSTQRQATPDEAALANRFKKALEARGLTLTDVAGRSLPFSRPTLSRLQNGAHTAQSTRSVVTEWLDGLDQIQRTTEIEAASAVSIEATQVVDAGSDSVVESAPNDAADHIALEVQSPTAEDMADSGDDHGATPVAVEFEREHDEGVEQTAAAYNHYPTPPRRSYRRHPRGAVVVSEPVQAVPKPAFSFSFPP